MTDPIYPIDMLATGASLQRFEPQQMDYISPEAGGRVGAVSSGPPLWSAEWQLGKMGAARSDEWRAWMMRLRGSQRTFRARDLGRPLPLLHAGGFTGNRPGGTPFNGLINTWSQTIDADGDAVLTLNDAMVGLSLSRGDYLGFAWGQQRRTLARVIEPATATSGGVVTVKVEPPVPTMVVPPTALIQLNAPHCIMRLVPGASELGPIDRRLGITSGKVVAIQDLRA